MNNSSKENNYFTGDLTASKLYKDIFNVNTFKNYLQTKRKRFNELFGKNVSENKQINEEKYEKKVDLTLKIPSFKEFKNRSISRNIGEKPLRVRSDFKPVYNSWIKVDLIPKLPTIQESIRTFKPVQNIKPESRKPLREKQQNTKEEKRYQSKTLKFDTDKKEMTSNAYIDNLESNISTLSKYMNFDANTRERIMNSKFKGDHIVPFSPFFEHFCNIRSNLAVPFNENELCKDCAIFINKHSIEPKYVYYYGEIQLNNGLVSMEAVEKNFPKEFREKAIPYAKTSSPFYKQKSKTKAKEVISSFKSLKVKPPKQESNPIKSAQNRIARYLAYRSVGLANYNFKFSKAEREALSKQSQEATRQVVSKSISLGDILTKKIFRNIRNNSQNITRKQKDLTKDLQKSSKEQQTSGFYSIDGLDL
ncbi:hypothetical protein [Lactobacillus johnsonii]|jgi:hypothetical protein|uniref:Uncharacterized protein n=1 Tax=Lactobacillus johnsonii TaxID=33959 RepID=A0A9X7XUZ3_LACJH|nr:hypothetical protein [Lactobacillus johnsonii]QIA88622.1 hypothetical protein FEE39_10290 [Lactobacillus johnsonii]